MKITHYLYNAFLIESGASRIVIDPGALFFYFFRLTSLIPRTEWPGVTHILVTHGDIDHYWHADRVAQASGAPVVCNATMARSVDGKTLALGPRDKGLAFTTDLGSLHTIGVGQTIRLDGVSVTGIKTTHGPLTLRLGPFARTLTPGPDERIGWGAIGFRIELDGKALVNLGDSLLHEKEWAGLGETDVLMLPIGGRTVGNTMDEGEALRAVRTIEPRLVIPCHYDCPGLFSRRLNPADEAGFKNEVEKLGLACAILHQGDSIEVEDFVSAPAHRAARPPDPPSRRRAATDRPGA